MAKTLLFAGPFTPRFELPSSQQLSSLSSHGTLSPRERRPGPHAPPPCRSRRRPGSLQQPRACAAPYGKGAEGLALVDSGGEPLLHVVFVSPQIHWNTGNIGRSALGLGVRLHLVGPLGFSLDERQVRRAGLDYWHHVDLRVYEDWEEFSRPGGAMETLGGKRYFYTKFGADAALDVDYSEGRASADEPVVLLFGSEVDGFTCIEDWLENGPGRRERRVAFPMVNDNFRAYNLSTTASMSVWDAYKSLTHAARRDAEASALAAATTVN